MSSRTSTAVALPEGTRNDRRRARTRAELLAAAKHLLASKGFHATKVTDIAAAADVGTGTFYLHFPTKEALFDAVVEDTVAGLKAVTDAARAAATDPIEKMRSANSAFCRFAHQNREVFRIVFGHAAAYNDVIRRAQQLFAIDVEETIREGIADGLFVPLAPELVAQAFVGMATQVLSWWTDHEPMPIETLQETMTTLALHGLCTPAAPNQGVHHG